MNTVDIVIKSVPPVPPVPPVDPPVPGMSEEIG